jgi:Ca2+-binding RTX toxin-like protein
MILEILETRAMLAVTAQVVQESNAVSVTPYDQLQVTSNSADKIDIACSAGMTKINGNDPDTGPFACVELQSIEVTGGPGDNKISLRNVTPQLFPNMGIGIGTESITRVLGMGGKDRITGSPFHDVLYGGAGDDRLDGGSAGDYLYGEGGNDKVSGQDGDDIISGGTGADKLNGGAGTDRLDEILSVNAQVFDNRLVSSITEKFAAIEEVLLNGQGNATALLFDASQFSGSVFLFGGNGSDTLIGGSGDDVLGGGSDTAGDSMLGGLGNDSLYGHGGNDTLRGQAGDDELTGAAGDDYLYGGPGVDELNSDADDVVVLQDDIIIIL